MKTLEERFWPKVEKTPDCWLWRGAINVQGYGTLDVGGRKDAKKWKAHRIACVIAGLKLKSGLVARHECNVRHCVRVAPGHVQLGTQKDNMRDRELVGNTRRGFQTGSQIPDMISGMLILWNTGRYSTRKLAAQFDIPKSTVHSIVTGKSDYANQLGFTTIHRSRSDAAKGSLNGSYKHGNYVGTKIRRVIEE